MKKKAPKMSAMRVIERLDTHTMNPKCTLPAGWMKLYKALQEKVK